MWYDTARYKREIDYTVPSILTWHVPQGFNAIWARVYYALNGNNLPSPSPSLSLTISITIPISLPYLHHCLVDFEELGAMQYEISRDGVRWFNAEALTADGFISHSTGVATNPTLGFPGYWFARDETASLPWVYTYFR